MGVGIIDIAVFVIFVATVIGIGVGKSHSMVDGMTTLEATLGSEQ